MWFIAPMIILYAEDDIDDFNLFCDALALVSPDAKVLNARNGAEALEVLENITVLPEAIFLDINMPTMDGKSCLKELKRNSKYKLIPVVVYTTSTDERDIALCKELGAFEFVSKPNNTKDAIDKLSVIMTRLKDSDRK
jgi:CheY-like chemotaxis protein